MAKEERKGNQIQVIAREETLTPYDKKSSIRERKGLTHRLDVSDRK